MQLIITFHLYSAFEYKTESILWTTGIHFGWYNHRWFATSTSTLLLLQRIVESSVFLLYLLLCFCDYEIDWIFRSSFIKQVSSLYRSIDRLTHSFTRWSIVNVFFCRLLAMGLISRTLYSWWSIPLVICTITSCVLNMHLRVFYGYDFPSA